MLDRMFECKRVVGCDFEYGIKPNGAPDPHCMVAGDLYTGQEWVLAGDDLKGASRPPFDIGDDTLFVAYNAEAELSSFLELDWAMPRKILDFWPEFRAITNGYRSAADKTRLIDMLVHYELFHIDADEKEEMQQLALRGPPYTAEEWRLLIAYCRSDKDALLALANHRRLLEDLARFHPREILHRGRFMAAVARKTRHGIPVDVAGLNGLRTYRAEICRAIAQNYEATHHWGIYDGAAFRYAKYEEFLDREGICDLPRTKKKDRVTTKSDILAKYEIKHPKLSPLRQCVGTLDLLSAFNVPVFDDGRTRCFANSLGSITGRDQPSTTKNLFGLPKMFRFYIMPAPGQAVAYVDCSSQEIWLAAMLSGDERLLEAYFDDIYVQSLIAVGKLPPGATREGHPEVEAMRNKVGKPFVLGTNYGQREWGLSARLSISTDSAETILRRYSRSFRRFHQWRQGIVNGAVGHKHTYFTKLGWPYWTGKLRNARSMMNFPMQAGGADWMRTALIGLTEAGIGVGAAVHDGFLVSGPAADIAEIARQTKLICAATGEALWGVAPIVRCEQIVRWDDPFPRFNPGDEHRKLFDLVQGAVQRLSQGQAA
jgi:hypothetical protein